MTQHLQQLADMMSTIRTRAKDYTTGQIEREREELIALWKAAYPDAANERSEVCKPLLMVDGHEPPAKQHPTVAREADEQWTNDLYVVLVRRWDKDLVFGTGGGMIQIGISAHDGTARHDWRHFQAIKNQIAGPEVEGFELYPAESRLLDPSNYFTLWCFPALRRIRVGINEPRKEWGAEEALAPQRGLPEMSIATPGIVDVEKTRAIFREGANFPENYGTLYAEFCRWYAQQQPKEEP
jgi:hypothetical protein